MIICEKCKRIIKRNEPAQKTATGTQHYGNCGK